MKISHFTTLFTLTSTVLGHAYIKKFIVDGKPYPAFDPFESPKNNIINQPWDTTGRDNHMTDAYVMPRGGDDVVCKIGSKPVNSVAKAAAGSKISFRWTRWQFNHIGPIITYMAECNGKCGPGAQLNWFKIDQAGPTGGGQWATDVLQKQGKSYTVMLPKNIKNGNYLVRHEMIALRTSGIPDAQIYPTCLNVEITNGTAQQNPRGVRLQQFYTNDSPGISIPDVRAVNGGYAFPGPPIPPNLGNTPSSQLNPGTLDQNPEYSRSQETLNEPTDDNGTTPNAHLDWFAHHGKTPPKGASNSNQDAYQTTGSSSSGSSKDPTIRSNLILKDRIRTIKSRTIDSHLSSSKFRDLNSKEPSSNLNGLSRRDRPAFLNRSDPVKCGEATGSDFASNI
ncbi:Endoglucanase-4 [Arthrobotrys entomopaga]|nr:Endoglucanase-4 [Arthrobotrys entomopaga]